MRIGASERTPRRDEGGEPCQRVDPRVDPPAAACPRWRVANGVFALALSALTGLFWPTVQTMVHTWGTVTTYNHGFVIVPISGYLIWRQRASLAAIGPRPQPLGLLLIAGAAFAWLLGEFAGVTVLTQLAWIAMVQALVLSLYGMPITRRILFPLAFLVFAVPFGNVLIPHLQDLTAWFAVAALRASGIPVYRDALYMHIPAGSFFVAEACAGIRFLISTIVLGTLIAYVAFTSWWRRILIVAVAAALPVLANGIRVYGIVMIAHLSGQQSAADADHLVYGWLFFAVVTLSFLAIALAFRESGEKADGSVRPAAAPAHDVLDRGRHGGGALAIVSVATAAVLLAAAAPLYRHLPVADADVAALAWQPAGAAWTLAEGRPAWQPRFAGADQEILRTYTDGVRAVDVYLALYASQHHGKEVVNEMNTFADGDRWTSIGAGAGTAVIGGERVAIRHARLQSSTGRRLVWYWYWIDGALTADPLLAKLYQVRARLKGGSGAAAVIAVAADVQDRQEAAEQALAAFLRELDTLPAALNAALSSSPDSVTRAGED